MVYDKDTANKAAELDRIRGKSNGSTYTEINTPKATFERFEANPLSGKIEQYDPVIKPAHYNRKGVEAIDAIEASMDEEEFRGYLKGSFMKYIWRYKYKGKPEEDLKKARWYLDKLIERV